nr:hypothetical protein KPHV_40680 [Kitasatospora purpeofusca]
MYRQWLRDALRVEGYSDLYISMIGRATRATRRKAGITGTRTPERVKRAERTGEINALVDIATLYLQQSHDLSENDAAKLIRDHMAQWDTATDEDEERDKQAF